MFTVVHRIIPCRARVQNYPPREEELPPQGGERPELPPPGRGNYPPGMRNYPPGGGNGQKITPPSFRNYPPGLEIRKSGAARQEKFSKRIGFISEGSHTPDDPRGVGGLSTGSDDGIITLNKIPTVQAHIKETTVTKQPWRFWKAQRG